MSNPNITFNSTAKFTANDQVTLSGTTTGGGQNSVEVFDGGNDLGAAQITNGKWTFTADLSNTSTHAYSADVVSGAGQTATASAPFTVLSDIADRPYTSVLASIGSNNIAIEFHGSNGALQVRANETVDLNNSSFNFVETGVSAHTRFVFDTTSGDHQTITNFHAKGSTHDVLMLPHADFANLADVLRNTTMSHGSATITDPNSNASVTLTGVTKADLKSHPQDFSFHGAGTFL